MKLIKNKSPKALKSKNGFRKAMSVIITTTLLFSFMPNSLIVIAEESSEIITNDEGLMTNDELQITNEESSSESVSDETKTSEEIITNDEGLMTNDESSFAEVTEDKQTEDEQGGLAPLPEEGSITNDELRITNEGQTENEQDEPTSLPSTGEQGELAPLPAEDRTEDEQGGFTTLPEEDSAENLTKEEQKLEKTQIKLKDQNLTDKQKKKLLKKIEKIQKKEKSQEVKDLLNKHESKKNQLNEKFKKSNLTTSEKEEIKSELALELSSLNEINEQLKQDSQNALNAELTEEEKAQIEYIEPNYLFELQDIGFTEPNDELFNEQWSLNWITGGQLASPETTEKVIVAIIDTGIDYNHSDLQGQFWTSETCVDVLNEPIEGGCSQGGWDFVNNDPDPYPADNYSHGTAVAGIIAANTNNNLGVASLSNNNVQIMALRAANNGLFELDNIVSAIYFAVNNGADIINMSFGGPSYSEKLKNAIAYAQENNVLVVAAAGNYASNNDLMPIYPASFDLDNIISVAALSSPLPEGDDQDEGVNLAYFSNYGANSVDIAAPGVNILTTTPGNTYTALSGTSFAAPMVASALSFYVADPNFSYLPEEITTTEPETSNE